MMSLWTVLARPRHRNDFDPVAPHYEGLARLVSLGVIERSQTAHLGHLQGASRILIVGGGAGGFLLALLRQQRALGLRPHVLYLELSSRMLALTRQRLARELPDMLACVELRHGDEHALGAHDGQFDALVSNFFFDLFDDAQAQAIGTQLLARLSEAGCWMLVDWQLPALGLSRHVARSVFAVMYAFFRLASRVEVRAPPDYEALVRRLELRVVAQRSYCAGAIQARLLRRRTAAH